MPAKKATRRSVTRYQINHSMRSTTRTAVGNARRAVESGDAEAAATAVHNALSILDKAVKKGVLHKNNGSRSKSRLAARLNQMQAAP
ncbi:MAG: 30S ribosomal protein S20 [Chloroflexi bacterium]|nr:30S ribosomal protein S20 [Chloroflexota bacterium]MDA1218467.1 30S ribosomal protein S20 [Chloroflexota bacterium]PKB56846.1 MAG: 30S ribosomal protein S20 [SAR202 cluster bacterium Casp-Chloro-G3]